MLSFVKNIEIFFALLGGGGRVVIFNSFELKAQMRFARCQSSLSLASMSLSFLSSRKLFTFLFSSPKQQDQ